MGERDPAADLAAVLDVLSARGFVASRVSVSGVEVTLGSVEVPKPQRELTRDEAKALAEAAQLEHERVMYASAGESS